MGELTDKTKGTAKEVTGVVTGDRGLEAEGKVDRAKGGLKGGWERFKLRIREAFPQRRPVRQGY
jgi:uncharacterized protein YjbJ (UPF0337 family)